MKGFTARFETVNGREAIVVSHGERELTAYGVTDLLGQAYQVRWSREMVMEAWSEALQARNAS